MSIHGCEPVIAAPPTSRVIDIDEIGQAIARHKARPCHLVSARKGRRVTACGLPLWWIPNIKRTVLPWTTDWNKRYCKRCQATQEYRQALIDLTPVIKNPLPYFSELCV